MEEKRVTTMNQPQPSIQDIREMWATLVVHPSDVGESAVQPFLDALRAVYVNGRAVYRAFRYDPHPILEWFTSTRRLTLPAFDLASGLVTHPTVRSSLSEVQIPGHLLEPLVVEELDEFDLEASLARSLVIGGAYECFSGTQRQAQQLVAPFVDVVAPDMHRCWFGASWMPWTEWFFDVAWDRTWIGLNPTKHSFWVLCATDTD